MSFVNYSKGLLWSFFLCGILVFGSNISQAQDPLCYISIGAQVNKDVTCDHNGEITVAVSTGKSVISIIWSGPGGPYAGYNNNNLPPGTYTIIATNSCGYTASTTATINDNRNLQVTGTVVQPKCGNDGSITLNITGAGSSTNILWNDGNTSGTRTGLGGGTYNVTVTSGSCTATASFTLNPPPPPLAFNFGVIQPTCGDDGEILAAVVGGTDPISVSPNRYLSGLGAATYTFTATDGNGCTVTGSVTLNAPLHFDGSISAIAASISCQYTVQANGIGGVPGYTYLWSNGSTNSSTTLGAGTHTVTITDSRGCTVVKTITISCSDGGGDNPNDPPIGMVRAYPNPNTGLFTLDVPVNEASNIGIQVVNSGGAAVYNQNMGSQTTSVGSYSINISSEPAGNYTAVVTITSNSTGAVTVQSVNITKY